MLITNDFIQNWLRGKYLAIKAKDRIQFVKVGINHPDRLYHSGGGPSYVPVSYVSFRVLKIYDPVDFPSDFEGETDWEALNVQFYRDFPPKSGEIGESGWLAPDGTFYACESYEHDYVSESLSAVYYNTLVGTQELEEHHWLRISRGVGCFIRDTKPTQAQINTLQDLVMGNVANNEREEVIKQLKRTLELAIHYIDK